MPNVGPYIYDVSISGFTRRSIYIHDISSLRVKGAVSVSEYIALKDVMIMNVELEDMWMDSLIIDRTATFPAGSEENRQ